jgi:hypothetical protein
MTAAVAGPRRFRPGLKAMANSAGILVLVVAAAIFPLSAAAHEGMLSNASQVVVFLPIAGVGLVIARRLPRNPIGWLLLAGAAGPLLSAAADPYVQLVYRLGHRWPLGPLALVLAESWVAVYLTLPLVILLFPDGTLPSRRWRTALWAYLGVALCLVLSVYATVAVTLASGAVRLDASGGLAALENPSGSTAWVPAVTSVVFPLLGVFWIVFVGRMVLSWRRSGGARRQQLKWLLSGAAVAVADGLASTLFSVADPHPAGAAQVVTSFLDDPGVIVLTVCVGVAIVKYRLYDIDRIISRTLAYAIVTGLLIGLYAGLVLLATRVLSLHAPVAVAAATLAAAALFNPLRQRVQRAVDRRFNRTRYDADQTVAAFAARLKDEVDLDSIQADLAGAVQSALEPAHISIWASPRA